jgi:hypothetical protein
VASKYDTYWAGQLELIHAKIQAAAAGAHAVVEVPELHRLGTRQSWYGIAEVRGRELTHSSKAHAKSLGKAVAASGICERWPDRTFRFTIGTAGGVLTIITAKDTHIWSGGPAARSHRQHLAPAQNARLLQPARRTTASHHGYAVGGGTGDRQADTDRFYLLLEDLARRLDGSRRLRDCDGRSGWPRRGVYFFYEDGEVRVGGGPRVVRVGTHALKATDKTTLWTRLRQHRGYLVGRNPGGGNHRESVFRRHVGAALIQRSNSSDELLTSWLDRHRPVGERSSQEPMVEVEASRHVRAMPFLWLTVPDMADRDYIERNSIALLSCLTGGVDPPSASWLGHYSSSPEIRDSGLWNIDHVNDRYEPGFLLRLSQLVAQQ